MAQVDTLLRMLSQHQGDELILTPGNPPRLLRSGGPLRLFFPQVDDAMYDLLLGDLLTAERKAEIAQGETSRFDYSPSGLGRFEVELGASQARFRRRPEPPPSSHPRDGEATPPPAAPPAVDMAPPAPSPPPTALPSPRAHEPASRQLEALVEHVLALGASDLHLADGEPASVRVDGTLQSLEGTPGDVSVLLREQLDEEARQQLASGVGVDRAVTVAGTRLRLHMYVCDTGLAAAMRVLRRRAPSLRELDLPVDISGLARLKNGLVIVTGPTGSGKSTTLAALAQEALRLRRGLLITLEDPIEYTYELPRHGALVRQRELGRHVRDFPSGLRDALREDPDVLLIGEMRDPESIQLALTAAETGHLVLTSLHARTAPSAIERIVDAYPPERQNQIRVQLADCMQAVIAQQLLPRASGSGRIAAMEVLRGTRPVQHLIRDGRTAQLLSAIQTAAADGMMPMERCLRDMVRRGSITRDVAHAAAGMTHRVAP